MTNQYVSGRVACYKVFVYGSLMPGYWNFDRCVKSYAPRLFSATVKARLFWAHLPGNYPALMNEPKYLVRGYILEFKPCQIQEVLARLDTLEGYRPGSGYSYYQRVVKTATDLSGKKHRTFSYCFSSESQIQYLQSLSLEIKSGDWSQALSFCNKERLEASHAGAPQA